MAIAFARARYIGRASGGSAVRSAAYNAREGITDERTGALYYFAHRDAPEHHGVLLPEGASEALRDAKALWNAAEAAENRRNSQVAREIVLALPANAEVSPEDRIELARSFVERHFVSKGLAVQLDVHAPHVGDGESERANHHAHLLITTRRVEGGRLSAKKARDLDPEVKTFRGRAAVTEGEQWGAAWRDHQNRYFAEHGMTLRVDAASVVPEQHVGPIRMRAADAEANVKAEAIRRENAAAARDPERVLAALTRNNATFTERDVDRFLAKHLRDEVEHRAVKGRVLHSASVLELHDAETGEKVERFTTRVVREQEREALSDAERAAGVRHQRGAGETAKAAALASRSLRDDQRAAFEHALGVGGLKIIEGRAGTGKSYTLAAIREAHELDGRQVIGLAPTNSVAQDLRADGFATAATLHSELFRLKNGRATWDKRTVVIVDEAAMLDSRVTGELMAEAKRSGAKLVLAGDDRQLASIERGGLFSELRRRHGSAEITEVTRQQIDWQRQAARDLAEGRVEAAVSAFAEPGAITWTRKQDEARTALIERWKADTAEAPEATRFVFAYTNKDVDKLNAELRAVRREQGELGEDHRFITKHGEAAFAVGDRVQFSDTLRSAKIYNGNAGTITGIDADTGVIRATLDGSSAGREVVWSASEFAGFRHGYAGTIYKGQGKTLDHTYLLHTEHWRQASSYVALTRQRESARIFAATATARDARDLAWQMSRVEVRSASVAWATWDELKPELRQRTGRSWPGAMIGETDRGGQRREGATKAPSSTVEAGPGTRTDVAAPAAAEPAAWRGQNPEAVLPTRADDAEAVRWLVPPRVSPDGRDSLGRGLDPASIAAATAGDRAAQREWEALGQFLEGAYRDPDGARSRLDDLAERDGYVSAARRLTADPGQLGELQGGTGLFAGSKAMEERTRAERAAEAVGPAVSRIGEAETKAAQDYRASVERQLAAEATGMPRLSGRAQAAVEAVAAARDDAGRAEAWKTTQNEEPVRKELTGFADAAGKRFGEDGVRAMLRAERPGAKPYEGDPSVDAEHRAAVAEAGRTVASIRAGEGAEVSQAEAERLTQRTSQGAHLKP